MQWAMTALLGAHGGCREADVDGAGFLEDMLEAKVG